MSGSAVVKEPSSEISGTPPACDCTVQTSFGAVRGVSKTGCAVFRGVPYADCPVRFKRPSPPQPWDGVRDCSQYSKNCIQGVFDTSAGALGRRALRASGLLSGEEPLSDTVSEDSLFCNVTTPSVSGCAPVMVWIHGGAFVMGSGSDGLYRGTKLTRSEQIVVVSMNYRLGAFGFLNVPGGDANCGIWDQLECLRWIQSEIGNFGGDPGNVTIFGESAGGMSCGVLLTSPLAQPFFHRAILMSGALSNVMTREDAAGLSHQVCRNAGTEVHADALRKLTAQELLSAQFKVKAAMPFQPCVDGELIPHLPFESLIHEAEGLRTKQVILGTCANEWNLFRPIPSLLEIRTKLASTAKNIASHAGPAKMAVAADKSQQESIEHELRTLLKNVRADKNLGNWGAAEKELMTTLVFGNPGRQAAVALSGVVDSVYVYSYNFGAGRLGAAHATELPLLFGTHNKHWMLGEFSGHKADPQSTDRLSHTLMACFGSFARNGSPTPPALPEASAHLQWPQYTSGDVPAVFVFDKECKVVHEDDNVVAKTMSRLFSGQQRPFGVPGARSKL